jgi:cytochrome c oxidase subunit 2
MERVNMKTVTFAASSPLLEKSLALSRLRLAPAEIRRRVVRRFVPLMVLWIAGLSLCGCTTVQSTLSANAHGPAARSIASLSWIMTILFLLVTLIMWGLLVIAFTKRRGSLSWHAPVDAGRGQAWIMIGGLIVPLLILTILFVQGLRLLAAFPIHGTHEGGSKNAMTAQIVKPDILIIGHQWWWEVHYLGGVPSLQFTTANEIHIPTGRAVNIELQSADVIHSFWVPSLHGKVDMIPGHDNFIRIEATDPGSYEGQCAEYCGVQHSHMRILVVAQAADEYAAWLAQQRKPGAEPVSQSEVSGKQTFLASQCATCHQVRGTPANGRMGPDLTHIGSRQYLASNIFPNNTAYLEAWITNAQSLKPGAKMPSLPEFTGPQLIDLVAYLQHLN